MTPEFNSQRLNPTKLLFGTHWQEQTKCKLDHCDINFLICYILKRNTKSYQIKQGRALCQFLYVADTNEYDNAHPASKMAEEAFFIVNLVKSS